MAFFMFVLSTHNNIAEKYVTAFDSDVHLSSTNSQQFCAMTGKCVGLPSL
jgi:hypothetical protein